MSYKKYQTIRKQKAEHTPRRKERQEMTISECELDQERAPLGKSITHPKWNTIDALPLFDPLLLCRLQNRDRPLI